MLGAAVSDSVRDRVYFPHIDGLRSLAFLLVLIHHFYPPAAYFTPVPVIGSILGVFNEFGWTGVDIFLVLSSFLICHLLLLEKDRSGMVSVKSFLIRRALRIWPIYFPYLLLSMIVWPLVMATGPMPDAYFVTIRQHLFPFLMFLGNFSYSYFHASLAGVLFAHLWTVCLEEQFYLVIPILLAFLRTPRWNAAFLRVAFALFAFAIACRIYVIGNAIPYPMVWTNTLCRIDPFVVGAGCALLIRSRPRWLTREVGRGLFVLSIAGFGLVVAFPNVGQSMNTAWQLLVVSLSAGCLILSAMTPGGVRKFFSWGYLPFLGKISFGLYVYHQITLTITAKWLTTRPVLGNNAASFLIDFVIVSLLTIFVAAVSYRIYERPILRFKERFEFIRSRPA
jgi:peptidoglycan/LPS O-acetylase OafA/YrhL